jgi:hypothetical protein
MGTGKARTEGLELVNRAEYRLAISTRSHLLQIHDSVAVEVDQPKIL